MEFFKKLLTKGTALWAGWSAQQRLIFSAVIIVVIAIVIALFRVSSTPVMVTVITRPITDDALLDRIGARLDLENINFNITASGILQTPDETSARRIRAILNSENLLPTGINPWEVFDRERWTITDFERNANFRRAQTQLVINHIKAFEDVDDVGIQIVWPTRELFRSDQNPVTVSVRITPKPGSAITQSPQNRAQIEGIQRILQFAIEGLQPEHIVIVDHTGRQLNDFEGLAAADRLSLIEQEIRIRRRQEDQLRERVLTALQRTFSADRVRDLNIVIDMDMSQRSVDTRESFPVTIRSRTPGLPYDDSEIVPSLLLSESLSETIFEGTGFNPEGPPGMEANVMPAFRDMSNLYGRMTQTTRTHNQELNQRLIQEERSPSVDRITVSVNIDGVWRMVYDHRGNPVVLPDGSIEREYTPVSDEDLRNAEDLVRDAVGFNSARGDSVTVRNIPIDRTEEFRIEDAAFFRQRQIQTTIIVFIIGLTLLLFGFMLIRVISREMERRKRLAEEERARREQMLRESAMAEAEQDGMDVSISLEERSRMELMENAINMAKEHPEDAAQLIRTWLLEE